MELQKNFEWIWEMVLTLLNQILTTIAQKRLNRSETDPIKKARKK
jgi:hypothetical protein